MGPGRATGRIRRSTSEVPGEHWGVMGGSLQGVRGALGHTGRVSREALAGAREEQWERNRGREGGLQGSTGRGSSRDHWNGSRGARRELWGGSNTKRAAGRGRDPPGVMQRPWGSLVLWGLLGIWRTRLIGIWAQGNWNSSGQWVLPGHRHEETWGFRGTQALLGHRASGEWHPLWPGCPRRPDTNRWGGAGGAGDLWALGGYWASSRGAVTPTLLPWGSMRWGAWPLPHALGVPELTHGTGGPQLLPSCLGVHNLGRGDSFVPLTPWLSLCQVLCEC